VTLFDHQKKEINGSAPLRTVTPLLPMQSPVTLLSNLVTVVPQSVKGGTPEQLNSTLDLLKGLQNSWDLPRVAREYLQETGRSLLNDLLDVFEPWIDVRRDVAFILQSLMPSLTWQAFLEQVAYGVAYAQEDDLSDAKGGGEDTNMKGLIRAAGFQPGPLIRGRWGLQFRSLKPMPSALKQVHIVAFRGTEGVKPPWKNPLDLEAREGMVDTWIGDLTRMGAGYPQYMTNQALIRRHMGANKHSAVTGHSLGGGLAQIVMAKLPDLVTECVTFNAPGIREEDAESLKKEKIPTTHHRTTFDVVPMGNSEAAPGTIYTYDRLTPTRNQSGWSRDENLTVTHNHMPINGLLNYEQADHLTPLQQKMRKTGVNGPAAADQRDQAVSALVSVKSTEQDRMIHGGEVALSNYATYKTFAANLGYNLLVEYAQTRIAALDPAKLNEASLDERLQQLQAELLGRSELPVSAQAAALFSQMNLAGYAAKFKLTNFKQGHEVKLRSEDRQASARQVPDMWRAWWPGGLK
jgi:pimeloyl-ACP methyl ester carboxylesterase